MAPLLRGDWIVIGYFENSLVALVQGEGGD